MIRTETSASPELNDVTLDADWQKIKLTAERELMAADDLQQPLSLLLTAINNMSWRRVEVRSAYCAEKKKTPTVTTATAHKSKTSGGAKTKTWNLQKEEEEERKKKRERENSLQVSVMFHNSSSESSTHTHTHTHTHTLCSTRHAGHLFIFSSIPPALNQQQHIIWKTYGVPEETNVTQDT